MKNLMSLKKHWSSGSALFNKVIPQPGVTLLHREGLISKVKYLISKLQIPPRGFIQINSMTFNSNYVTHGEEVMDEQLYKFEKSINEVKLLGRVGQEPVVSEKNGKPFVQFLLGTNRPPDRSGTSPPTEWHSVFTFHPELVKSVSTFVKKGNRVYVSGKLSYVNDVNTKTKITGVLLYNYISFS